VTACLAKCEEELNQLKEQHALIQLQTHEIKQERDSISQDLQQEIEKINHYQNQNIQYQQSDINQKSLIQEKEEQIKTLCQEKDLLASALSQLQEDYEQVSSLEKRYQQELSQQMEKIRYWQEKLTHQEKETASIHEQRKQIEIGLVEQEKILRIKQEEFNRQLKQADEITRKNENKIQELQEDYQAIKDQLIGKEQELAFISEQKKQIERAFEEQETEKARQNQDREEQLNQMIGQHQEQLNHLVTYSQVLEQQKGQLEQELNQLKSELDGTQKQLEKALKNENKLPYVSSSNRKIEGLYAQLKDQFYEKSSVLDATRRELFQVQEQLLKLQKDSEEKHAFEISEYEMCLHHDLNTLAMETELTQKDYQEELNALHKLVGDLLNQMVAYR
jgi:epidermal growth factor receptor substrate 15